MKTKVCSIVLAVFSLCLGLVFNGWALDEPVKGWYDSQNDWFAFEWNRPGEGIITAIDDPPNKIEPIIKARVEFNKDKNDYTYSYEITNQGGKQILFDIVFENMHPVYDAKAPSEEWYMDLYKYDRSDTWNWAKTRGELHGIPPGETVKGFSFKSQGPPAILNSVFYGKRRVRFSAPGDYDSFELMYSYERVSDRLEDQYKDKFKDVILKTVAPGPVPADLNPVAFLDNLISMKHEAFAQGWITNKGVETSLDAKLDAARRKLLSGSFIPARNTLLALVNEVEAQGCETHAGCKKGKHIKPEAYALLKYNALYLIDNLR